jgi:peptidyl-prolyl cis-trans isomerase A (cyclophilin A)
VTRPRIGLVALASAALLAGCGGSSTPKTTSNASPVLLHPARLHATAPGIFQARFKTTKGAFVVTVHRSWAPIGADRFYNLVRSGFYNGDWLFRVVPGFVVQWGINSAPSIAKAWENATIPDDAVRHSNARGTITFAAASTPNTRTTQVFVNLADNANLDALGFAPFGEVTSGMDVIAKLYSGYDDEPTNQQQQMFEQGAAFLQKAYPKLDRILSAAILG